MNRPAKRAASSFDNRSRPPKRRKTARVGSSEEAAIGSTGDEPEELEDLSQRFKEEEDIWPANKILRERGVGANKEYLVDWERHPKTGETFEPSWVGHVFCSLPVLSAE